jgi:hypothetical protein
MTDHRFPTHVVSIDPREVHSSETILDDIEELPVLLHPNEVRELIQAARQEGLSATALARSLIRDYLAWMRSDLGKARRRRLRLLQPGEER